MDRDNRIKWQKSGYDDDDNDDYGDAKAQQRAAEFLKWNQKMASRSQWGKKKAPSAQRAKRKLPLGWCRGTIKRFRKNCRCVWTNVFLSPKFFS